MARSNYLLELNSILCFQKALPLLRCFLSFDSTLLIILAIIVDVIIVAIENLMSHVDPTFKFQ